MSGMVCWLLGFFSGAVTAYLVFGVFYVRAKRNLAHQLSYTTFAAGWEAGRAADADLKSAEDFFRSILKPAPNRKVPNA